MSQLSSGSLEFFVATTVWPPATPCFPNIGRDWFCPSLQCLIFSRFGPKNGGFSHPQHGSLQQEAEPPSCRRWKCNARLVYRGYEFNIAYKERMEAKGLIFSGQDETKDGYAGGYSGQRAQVLDASVLGDGNPAQIASSVWILATAMEPAHCVWASGFCVLRRRVFLLLLLCINCGCIHLFGRESMSRACARSAWTSLRCRPRTGMR